MLGDKYEVLNFGVSGATLIRVGPMQYVNQPQYKAALDSNADIVVIMLGTNDANKDKWPLGQYTFVPLAKEMYAAFHARPRHPQVYACLPVPAFTPSDDRPINVQTAVVPLTRQAAREAGVKVIDLFSPLANHADLFPDKLHPNEGGAAIMAGEVYEAIVDQRIAKKGWKVVSVDSQQVDEGPAKNAIDGDPETYWHTQYDPTTPKHPHTLVVDLGKDQEIGGFSLLPRQDGGVNGRIKEYAFYVSSDGRTWAEVSHGEAKNQAAAFKVRFPAAVQARFLKLEAKSEQGNGPWTSLAELDVLKSIGPG
jgi:beta-galactosidase